MAAVVRRLLAKISDSLPDYEVALREAGCLVLHRPPPTDAMRIYLLPHRAGIVLGRVFPMMPSEWSTSWSWSPSMAETIEIVSTRGQRLIHQLWGAYIAFLFDHSNHSTYVLRDCSGRIPCYHMRHAALDLFFADPMTLCALGLVPASLNFDYICAYLCSSQLETRDTALIGVTELLAGDCFERRSAESYMHYSAWAPADVLSRPHIGRFSSAVREVRRTTDYCINAWASVFDTIVLSLSGGLDSSVVLASLAQHHELSTVICVNKFGKHASEDERGFARLAASRANVVLLELPMYADSPRIDESLTQQPLSAKPTPGSTIGRVDTSLYQIAENSRASCIWTGQGGDHLFMQMPFPLGPLDYATLEGFGLGLLRSISDAVHLSGWNYWRIARLLWSRDFAFAAPALGQPEPTESQFVTADAASRVAPEKLMHPWMLDASSLSIGQRVQVASLSQVLNRHRFRPHPTGTLVHHPLLSQPLLELCLRIPSFIHYRDGIDRAVERAAFADIVPKEIVTRKEKGVSTFSVLDIIHRSKNFICDLLLDGVLVKGGILNRNSIEPYITGHRPTDATTLIPLVSSITTELWIRNWRNCLDETSRAASDRPVDVQ